MGFPDSLAPPGMYLAQEPGCLPRKRGQKWARSLQAQGRALLLSTSLLWFLHRRGVGSQVMLPLGACRRMRALEVDGFGWKSLAAVGEMILNRCLPTSSPPGPPDSALCGGRSADR